MDQVSTAKKVQKHYRLPLRGLYEKMLRIRMVEEMISNRYADQTMRCPTHLSIGQEYAPVCLSEHLTSNDQGVSTHRPHAHYLAMGGNLKAMVAELYGKKSGCSGGRGGSMHLIDEQSGFKGSTAIVGNSIPIGVGLAWAKKIKQSPGIVVIFIGDAATEEGVFYESANFALIHELPVLFFCENNFYSVYSPLKVRQPKHRSIFQLAKHLGFDSHFCDGYHLENTYHKIRSSIETLKKGGRPQFLEIQTYRYKDHCGVGSDTHLGYRSEEELKKWMQRDPLSQLEAQLKGHAERSISWMKDLRKAIQTELDLLFEEVENEAFASPVNARECSFLKPFWDQTTPSKDDTIELETERDYREITYAQAINEALKQVMALDSDVICYGLGINDPKRIFGTTDQLVELFGEARVLDMPTAENGMLGIGIGAALNELKPVMVHQRLDFFLLAMDQLVNNAAKWFFTFGGKRSVPICIRLIVGRGWGQGPTHSQMLASWFAHIPGLKVVMPSTARDAKGLLASSILDPNPVIFIEHRWCHPLISRVPTSEHFRIPIGKANNIYSGSEITLVSVSYPIIECIQAAQVFEQVAPDAIDLLDLRSIAPIDWASILSSVEKTKRLLVIDPGWEPMGIGNEVIAHCVKTLDIEWKAKPACISLPHHAVPTGFAQTKDLYPTSEQIMDKIHEMLDLDPPKHPVRMHGNHFHDVPNPQFTGPF